MWSLLHSLTCPPMGPRLLDEARTLAGALEPCDAAGLVRLSACCYLLRPALPRRHWRRLRADLREQRRWWTTRGERRLTKVQRRRLRRQLRRAGALLSSVSAPPSNQAVYARLQRLHRKARRMARRTKCPKPGWAQARLAAALELTGVAAGLIEQGRLDDRVLDMRSPAFVREVAWRALVEAASDDPPRLISPGGAD